VVAFETLGSHIATSLQNARLYAHASSQLREMTAVQSVSKTIVSSLEPGRVMATVVELLHDTFGYHYVGLYVLWEGRLQLQSQVGYPPEHIIQSIPPGVGVSGRALRTRETQFVRDVTTDPDFLQALEGVQSEICVPLVKEREVLGILNIESASGHFLTEADASLLTTLGSQVTIALDNARLFAEQRRRTEEQRLLLTAEQDFSAALSESAVLKAIVEHMAAIINTAGCTISIWDRDQDSVQTLLDFSLTPSVELEAPGTGYALADYPATRLVLEERRPMLVAVDDLQADAAERALLAARGYGAVLMVPLASGEQVFGLVELHRNAGSARFEQADMHLAQNLAVQAGVALENARLHSAVQETVRELDALLTANKALLSTLELDQLLHNILAAAVEAIPRAEMGTISLADPVSERLRVRAVYGYSDPRIQTLSFAWDEGYTGKALSENQPLLLGDTRVGKHVLPFTEITESMGVRSAIVAPLVPKGSSGRPYGVISLDATRLNAFTPADLRILVAFANTAAAAIDNARLHAEVQRLAVTDSLTGLANPRAFELALATEAHRAARYGHPLSLIIMDIDSFKNYNDAYGHLAGNERLKAIADILHETVRDPDLPARYGGEEFALLLPHTGKAGAVILAERIRDAAQSAATRSAAAGEPISGYTLSLGVATFPSDAQSPQQLMLAADNAELAAKRSGKNRVCAAPALSLTVA
jgi:diguanylate cyclase (GGDEF)-like protein